MNYSPTIDGLRAVAIVPVVLFHAGFQVFSGGYVGVDIFFVISGYLITSLIYVELRDGRFSILRFYERRVRRIFPALFFLFIVCVVVCWSVFLPQDFESFGRSLAASSIFLSNVLFWREAGYFDATAETKPLLHTWSLSVEEQFYVLFPAFLYCFYRYAKRYTILTIVLCLVASLSLSIWAVEKYPNAGFYLAPTRVWELALGSLLALSVLPVITNTIYANLIALIGLLLIALSVFTYTESTTFPGLTAIVPCIGAGLIIYTNQSVRTAVGIALSLKPLVFIGLVSYSLYLWHWPLIVFNKQVATETQTVLSSYLIVIVSLAAAILSWRFIEKPFRGKGAFVPRKQLFLLAVISIGAFFLSGLTIDQLQGMPARLPPNVVALGNAAQDSPKRDECYNLSGEEVRKEGLCNIGASAAVPSFLVWGDSHAYALMPMFEELALDHGVAGLYASHGGCVPLIGVDRRDKLGSPGCAGFNSAVSNLLEKTPNIRSIILVGRWAEYYEVHRYKPDVPPLTLVDTVRAVRGDTNEEVFKRGLERTLAFLEKKGRDIVIVGQVPDLSFDAPRHLAIQALLGHQLTESFALSNYLMRQRDVMDLIESMRSLFGFEVLYPHRALCNEKYCAIRMKDVLLYRDSTHLTVAGSHLVKRIFDPYFSRLVSDFF